MKKVETDCHTPVRTSHLIYTRILAKERRHSRREEAGVAFVPARTPHGRENNWQGSTGKGSDPIKTHPGAPHGWENDVADGSAGKNLLEEGCGRSGGNKRDFPWSEPGNDGLEARCKRPHAVRRGSGGGERRRARDVGDAPAQPDSRPGGADHPAPLRRRMSWGTRFKEEEGWILLARITPRTARPWRCGGRRSAHHLAGFPRSCPHSREGGFGTSFTKVGEATIPPLAGKGGL